MGAPVMPRLIEVKEPSPKQPDFLVVKAGPTYDKDVPVVVVGVKGHDALLREDHFQMTQYMYRIWEKLRAIEADPRFFEHFRGYLVERQMTYEYRLPDMNNPISPEEYGWESVVITKKEFAVKIRERADLYRNVVPTFSSIGNPPGN
ncbi:hypothetical protein APHAL10511_000731 [Amanita phalloides]|nr:hypothetical protein APHAL10511_000731 [Amanita phalloides]